MKLRSSNQVQRLATLALGGLMLAGVLAGGPRADAQRAAYRGAHRGPAVAAVTEGLPAVVTRQSVLGVRPGRAVQKPRPVAPPGDEQIPKPQLQPGAQQQQDVVPPGGGRPRPFSASVASATPTASVEFTTVGDTNYFPADDAIAAGPAHLVAAANGALQVRTLAGSHISTVAFENFFAADPTGFIFDPRLSYDESAGRFYVTSVGRKDDGGQASTVVLAVSATSDPSGAWHKYVFDAGRTRQAGLEWADYPCLGYDGQAIYIASNMFTFNTGANTGTRLLVVSKSAALSGAALQPTVIDDIFLPLPFSPGQPATTLRPVEGGPASGPGLLLARAGTAGLSYFRITDPLGLAGTPSVASSFIDTTDFADNGAAPQMGSTSDLEAGDSRLQKTVYRNSVIWTTHSVSVSGTRSDRGMIRVYKVDPAGSGSLLDAETLLDANLHYYFPAVMPDNQGNAIVVFQGSDASTFPSLYHARYDAGTGTFTAPVLTEAGLSSYFKQDGLGRNRWGDYTDAALDVASGTHVWIHGVLPASATTWKKHAAKVLSAINAAPSPPSGLTAAAASTSQVNVSWSDNSANETGFTLERKVNGGAYALRASLGANVTSFQDTGLPENTTCTYRVLASNGNGSSAFSPEAFAVTPLGGPSNLAVSVISATQLRLTWTDNSGAESGFSIERRPAAGAFAAVGAASANATTFTDTGLAPQTTYAYRLRATAGGVFSGYSSEATGATASPGKMKLGPKKLGFRSVFTGATKLKTLTIKNVGKGVLSGNVGTMAAPYRVVSGSGAFVLQPGGFHVVTVEFAPTSVGTFPSSLTVTSDDPLLQTKAVLATGVGKAPK